MAAAYRANGIPHVAARRSHSPVCNAQPALAAFNIAMSEINFHRIDGILIYIDIRATGWYKHSTR